MVDEIENGKYWTIQTTITTLNHTFYPVLEAIYFEFMESSINQCGQEIKAALVTCLEEFQQNNMAAEGKQSVDIS